MFSPRSPYVRTPLSASKSQRFYGGGRRAGTFHTPTKRTFTPVSGDSRNQSLNRSYQLTVLEETAQHTVLVYGNPLPVLVTEAMTSAERISDISVRIEESGWASLVCGRRVFIWKYKQDSSVRTFVSHCRELTLPPSDLAHKADLVHVFLTQESQMPSALAVSPEGIVRYWPNIVHEGSSVEAATDLQGQECYSLTSVYPLGCILATTTSSLVVITPSVADGQHTIICRTLKVPQGVLAGIGRKVSSFIFGAMPTQASEAKQLTKVLSAEGMSKNDCFVYVLSCSTLQKWHLSEDEPDKLLFEHDMDRFLKEQFFQSIWTGVNSAQLHQLRAWCLDMQVTQHGVAILTAATNPTHSKDVYYAIAILDVANATVPPQGFSSFNMVKHSEKYQASNEEWLLNFKFILPSKTSQFAYVYNNYEVFCLSVSDPGADYDMIDASAWGDILGAGTCDGLPLFFSKIHSLLALQPTQQNLMDTSHVMTPHKELIKEQSVVGPLSDSLPAKLRSAMCMYYNNEIEKCQEMINELFPVSSLSRTSLNLDTAVIELSSQIIDDYPVSDPRWCESVPSGESVSSSLIILHQLDDKLKVHEYLVTFLKALGLFDRLSTVKVQENRALTKALLCEHAEKLIAAKAVRRFLVDYSELLDTAIKACLEVRNVELKNHLTHRDLFFREVSAVHSLFKSVYDLEDQTLADDAEDIISVITTVNRIFLGILSDVIQYRQSKESFYCLPISDSKVHYQPWTSAESVDGVRTVLSKQHALNIQYMLKASEDLHVQGAVFQQIVELTDFLLDGYLCEVESVKNTEQFSHLEAKYTKERNKLIKPLLEVEQFERAASLAEKYLDFDILMQICETTGNQELLQRYVIQFKDQGFSDYMFKWYLDKGMRKKLLDHPLGQQEELSRFLEAHGDLNWLHYIHSNQYVLAQKTLKELSLKEMNYLSKKKTLLSLSKLAALASDLPVDAKNNHVEAINLEQDLITHQENLPDCVVEAFGLDPDTMRVLTPEELIEMYICEENTSANSYDFKIALELLQFVKKPPGDSEFENLRLHVWCKAILHDNWDELDTSNPLEAIKDTVFFQVIELAYDQGIDLHEFVVPVDDLLQAPELSSVADNSNFAFLLRAGYEHIFKLIE